MHTEAIKTCIFRLSPVTEDMHLHTTIYVVSWVLVPGHRRKEENGEKQRRQISIGMSELDRVG